MAGRQDVRWHSANPAMAGYGPIRARLSLADLLLQLWRAKWLMGLIIAVITGLGVLAATMMPERHVSSSRLYVRVGQQANLQQVVQGELDMMQSPVIAERTLSRFPLERLYPKLALARSKALSRNPASQRRVIEAKYLARSVAAFHDTFSAQTKAHSPVVTVSFGHQDGAIAAEVLNAALATYLDYRLDVVGTLPVDAVGAQLKLAETDLLNADDAISGFLRANDMVDFDSQRIAAQALFGALTRDQSRLQADINATTQKIAKTRAQLAATPAELDLLVEGGPNQRLFNLQIDREELLARYTPDSQAVLNIDAQIARVETYLASLERAGALVRSGPNPNFQILRAALNASEAEAASQAGRKSDLAAQLAQIELQIAQLNALMPNWTTLTRNREIADLSVRSLAERQQSAGFNTSDASGEIAAIRILEPAQVPSIDLQQRGLIVLSGFALGGLIALIVGLMRAVTRRGFATAGAVQRTVGLPVIGQIRQSRSRAVAKHR